MTILPFEFPSPSHNTIRPNDDLLADRSLEGWKSGCGLHSSVGAELSPWSIGIIRAGGGTERR